MSMEPCFNLCHFSGVAVFEIGAQMLPLNSFIYVKGQIKLMEKLAIKVYSNHFKCKVSYGYMDCFIC